MEAGWEGSIHSEDLFFDNVALKQVLSKSEVTTDSWYFDSAKSHTIWFCKYLSVTRSNKRDTLRILSNL